MTLATTDTGKLKFGFGQLNKTTPKWANTLVSMVMYLCGVWAIIQHMNLGLAAATISSINEWAIASPLLVHFTTRFFGWDNNKPDTDNP